MLQRNCPALNPVLDQRGSFSVSLWQIHVALVPLHFAWSFSSNLRIIQGWIDLPIWGFKMRLDGVGNTCIKCACCNLRSCKYKRCGKVSVQPFSRCKVPLRGSGLECHSSGYWGQGEDREVTRVFVEFTWNGGRAGSLLSLRWFERFGAWTAVEVTLRFVATYV